MPAYILIPFAVFFACCVAQFWFMKRIRDALIDRHPDAFLGYREVINLPDARPLALYQEGPLQESK